MFYAPAQDVQTPTHPRIHVRDARDAHIVFEAVRQGKLKPVLRRLNEMERARYITSGSLFVWEESDDEMGLKRWTDGRVWSQSRMREVGIHPPAPSGPFTPVSYRLIPTDSRTYSMTKSSGTSPPPSRNQSESSLHCVPSRRARRSLGAPTPATCHLPHRPPARLRPRSHPCVGHCTRGHPKPADARTASSRGRRGRGRPRRSRTTSGATTTRTGS